MRAVASGLMARQIASADAPERAFEAVYAEHCDFVWRCLRRMGVQSAVVEDAVQDTFVIFHRRLSDLRPEASVRAFLFGIALRVAHDYRRSARRKGATSLDVEAQISDESGPFESTMKAEALRRLEQFLATLDDDKRAVFVLAELEQLSAPEISEALAVNLNTVYSRLRLARERFVAFLAAQGRSS